MDRRKYHKKSSNKVGYEQTQIQNQGCKILLERFFELDREVRIRKKDCVGDLDHISSV